MIGLSVPAVARLDITWPEGGGIDLSVAIPYTAAINVTGPAGPQGARGDIHTYIADGVLSGHRLVMSTGSGKVGYVDAANAAHAGLALGITTGAAVDAASVDVQLVNEMVEPSWSWASGPVYAGANGIPTQDTSTLAFVQVIGIATEPTKLMINIQPAILKG